MNRLWAPWRIKYVTQHKSEKCIFCTIYESKKDKKNFVVYRSRYCYSLLNVFPYNNGHIMVVANRHIKSLERLNNDEVLDLISATRKTIRLVKDALSPEGFNVGINIGKVSGAGVESHLHIHIVPRWQGDTNFMPVIGNTKIISQSLQELYNILKDAYKKKNRRLGRK